jgi:hypothetical protein
MFLKHSRTDNLVEVLSLHDLWDACLTHITGRYHAGEELQEPEQFPKADLMFPSGESLPRCWVDPHYREDHPSKLGRQGLVTA